jgi:hypothetical protein
MSVVESTRLTWQRYKPMAIALVVGLVIGPFISNGLGWQVTSSAARTQTHDGVVEQQALACERQARSDAAEPAKMDWTAQRELAKKAAAKSGAGAENWDVINACTRKLGV